MKNGDKVVLKYSLKWGDKLKAYLKFLDVVNKIIQILIIGLFVVMISAVLIQLLARMVFPHLGFKISVIWTTELPVFCMIWIIFLGVAIGVRYSKLIAIDIVQVNLPAIGSKALKIISSVICVGFFICLIISGYYYSIFGLTEAVVSLGISKFYLYVIMPISGIVMILNSVGALHDILGDAKEKVNYDLEV